MTPYQDTCCFPCATIREQVLDWKDLSPRFGLSYDMFGTGRTALKFSVSRYVLQEGKGNTNNIHPVIAATNSVSRTWTDVNRDFVVQGDPLNPALNGELGPSPNANFGRPNTTLQFDPTGQWFATSVHTIGNPLDAAARAHAARGCQVCTTDGVGNSSSTTTCCRSGGLYPSALRGRTAGCRGGGRRSAASSI